MSHFVTRSDQARVLGMPGPVLDTRVSTMTSSGSVPATCWKARRRELAPTPGATRMRVRGRDLLSRPGVGSSRVRPPWATIVRAMSAIVLIGIDTVARWGWDRGVLSRIGRRWWSLRNGSWNWWRRARAEHTGPMAQQVDVDCRLAAIGEHQCHLARRQATAMSGTTMRPAMPLTQDQAGPQGPGRDAAA